MSDKIYYSIIIIMSLISLYFFFNVRNSKLNIIEKGTYLLTIIFVIFAVVFLPEALNIYVRFKGETGASPLFFIAILNLISFILIGFMYKKILYLKDRIVNLEQQTSLIDFESKND